MRSSISPLALLTLVACGVTQAEAGYWPQWRGPDRDNRSKETGLLKEWPEGGPPRRWEVQGIGKGTSAVAVRDGRIFVLGFIDDSEYVSAIDERTGRRLWATSIGPALSESPSMRWICQRTPTVDRDLLYAFRGDAKLVALRTTDGKEVWRKDYIAEFGAERQVWGNGDYPLVEGDRLILTPGGTMATIAAVDKQSGNVIWKSTAPGGATRTYAATLVIETCGVRQYVAHLGTGLFGFRAADGSVLWSHEANRGRSLTGTPILLEGALLAVPERYVPRLSVIQLTPCGDTVVVEEKFSVPAKVPYYDDAVAIGSHLYGGGVPPLACLRLDSGQVAWRDRVGRGSNACLTFADERLYLYGGDTIVWLVEPSPEKLLVKSSFSLPGPQKRAGPSCPVVAGGHLYLRDENRILCYDVREHDANSVSSEPMFLILEPPGRTAPSERAKDSPRAVFVATPEDVVEKMLEMAEVKPSDVLYDLGSGDGRILVKAAATFECKAVGFEIDDELVRISRRRINEAGVNGLVRIEERDLFTADLDRASVVAVYLPEEMLGRLSPQFERLKPGSRIVSHQFKIPGATPDRELKVESKDDGQTHLIYVWTAPLKATRGDR